MDIKPTELFYEVSTKKLEEQAHTVFVKVSEMIFEVKKDRSERHSGRSYVSYQEVIDTLNEELKTLIINKKDKLIHKNFNY